MADEKAPEQVEQENEAKVAAQPTPPADDGPSAAETAEKYAGSTMTGSPPKSAGASLKDATAQALEAKQRAGVSDRVVAGPGGSADLDLDDVRVVTVKLGGQLFRAYEPTIEVNKILAKSLPTIKQEDGATAEAAEMALNSLYPQVSEILKDPRTSEPPSREFVERHLTSRNFGRLMDKLNAEAMEGNPEAG